MECACIRGNYKFHVEAIDKDKLIYKDASDWMDSSDGSNYCDPDEYDVTIIPPGTSNSTTLTLKVTSHETIELDGGLKDGIYCFEVTSCGVTYQRFKAIFPNMQCCVDKAYISGVDIEKIQEVESNLNRASINAEMKNEQSATHNLKVAKALLENIQCDCDC